MYGKYKNKKQKSNQDSQGVSAKREREETASLEHGSRFLPNGNNESPNVREPPPSGRAPPFSRSVQAHFILPSSKKLSKPFVSTTQGIQYNPHPPPSPAINP